MTMLVVLTAGIGVVNHCPGVISPPDRHLQDVDHWR